MIDFEITGLKELIRAAESIATPRELEAAERRALNKCIAAAMPAVKNVHPRSKDVSRSGRKGSRTFQHAADNIPSSISRKDGKIYALIGWDKGDVSPYYYEKFIEFGSSKQPPQAPFKKAFTRTRKQFDNIFKEEFESLLDKLN